MVLVCTWGNIRCCIGTMMAMRTVRKITVEVPAELLEKAGRATGAGIMQTVRTGLQIAASPAYARLRQFRGKYRYTLTLDEMKDDRRS